MKKFAMPLTLVLLLAACSDAETSLPEDEEATEVAAPEGELDPTNPEEVGEAEATPINAIVNGDIPEGDPVMLTGTIGELTNDGAFIMFTLTADNEEILIRNMAETAVEAGETITVEGIYEGIAEEGVPLLSVSVIEKD